MKTLTVSQSAREVLTLGRKNHYWFRVLGVGEMLTDPKYANGWWLIPTDINDTQLAPARKRIDLVLKSTPIQGIIMAHEAPRLLCEGAKPKIMVADTRNEISLVIGKVLLGTMAVGVGLAALSALLPVVMVLGVALVGVGVDPAVMVVLPDGTIMEVMRWYDS